MKIPIIALRVADQDSALKFYTDVLGFTVTEDMDLGPMRWITVRRAEPRQPVVSERGA
jgi:catechol 2,3-dioxygenase-like lactoylglutathione lyase family enzyme